MSHETEPYSNIPTIPEYLFGEESTFPPHSVPAPLNGAIGRISVSGEYEECLLSDTGLGVVVDINQSLLPSPAASNVDQYLIATGEGTASWQPINVSFPFVPYSGATGDVDLGTHNIKANGYKLALSPSGTPAQGQFYWNATDNTASLCIDDVNNVNLDLGHEQYVRIVNKTGVQINDGQVVYINGAQGNRPTAALAVASSLSTSMIIGVATQNIAINQEGNITTLGVVHGFNTSSFSVGDPLYLSSSVAGALTKTVPSSPNFNTRVAVALNSTNNGSILVYPDMPISLSSTLIDNSDLVSPSEKAVKIYVDTGLSTKQASLGFTPENVSNKQSATGLGTSDTYYPTQNAVKTYVDNGLAGKQNTGTYVTSVGASGALTSSGGTTPTISIAAASISASGAVQLSNSYVGTSQSLAVTEKALSDGLATVGGSLNRLTTLYEYADFLYATAGTASAGNPSYLGAAIGSGSVSLTAVHLGHAGVIAISSGAANGGYRYITATGFKYLNGGEVSNFVFRTYSPIDANNVIWIGFHDTISAAAPTDAVSLNISGNVFKGITYKNTATTSTSTTHVLSTNTWYRGKISVNSAATRVDFYLYDSSGNQLWTDNITTNLPTGSTETFGHGLVAYNTNVNASIIDIDFMDMLIPNLVR